MKGWSKSWQGVYGHSETNAGVVGESDHLHGVIGIATIRKVRGYTEPTIRPGIRRPRSYRVGDGVNEAISGVGSPPAAAMIRALLAATLLVGGSAALAQEPTNCTPIHFATGQSSATVRGSVGSSDEPIPCYTLATGRGQTATFKFTKTNEIWPSASTVSLMTVIAIPSRRKRRPTNLSCSRPCDPHLLPSR